MVMGDEAGPNMVNVLLDWTEPSAAHAFAASNELKAAIQSAGVRGLPEIHFLSVPPNMVITLALLPVLFPFQG